MLSAFIIMNAIPQQIVGQERRILDNLSSAVIFLDRELRVRFANTAAEELTSMSARQMSGSIVDQVFTRPDDDLVETLADLARQAQPTTERELQIKLHDGRVILVDWTVIPLQEIDGDGGCMLEIQQVNHHLKISREESLLQRQQATQDVVRGLAHEIKNPLGGLRGAAQLLKSELDDEELKEYTQIIIEEADRLQALVNRMIGPSRLPEYAWLNVHQVLERVRSLVLAEMGSSLQIIRDYDPSIPDLYGDADQLIQSFLNIVRNAARAVAPAQGKVILRSRVVRNFTIGNHRHRLVAKIDVEDNGPGIPADIRDKLFFPMVTSGTGGMGLGLSIAQTLINRHQGLVEFESHPGKTVFTIFLPVEELHD